MDTLQYPTLIDREKKKRHKEIFKVAYPEKFENRVVKTTDLELF